MSTLPSWDVEDNAAWEGGNKKIANRNLWISIPNLLCGFAVWLYWGMIVKVMQGLHFGNTDLFNFTFGNDGQPLDGDTYRALLFNLPAIAGLAGATLRIPNSFMINLCGGRNVKFMTTLLLILPAIDAGFALQNPNTPFMTFVVLAALSGIGGGAFASSMSNISFFFPKRMQGLSLGLNAGLGNAGVTVGQPPFSALRRFTGAQPIGQRRIGRDRTIIFFGRGPHIVRVNVAGHHENGVIWRIIDIVKRQRIIEVKRFHLVHPADNGRTVAMV